jgi:hypothetical protein
MGTISREDQFCIVVKTTASGTLRDYTFGNYLIDNKVKKHKKD